MDWDKRITGIVFASIFALAITACKVHTPGYVSLFVDNSMSVNDTVDLVEVPQNKADIAMNQVVDTSVIDTADLVEVPLNKADTSMTHELDTLVNDTINLVEVPLNMADTSMTHLVDTSVNDTIDLVEVPLNKRDPTMTNVVDTTAGTEGELPGLLHPSEQILKSDTVHIDKEIVKQPEGDSPQKDYKTLQLLQATYDTIAFLRKQVHELQNKERIKTDTIYEFETARLPVVESSQTELMTLQMIKAKDEQIQMLQNQLNTMQTAAATSPRQIQITREPAQPELLGSQQTDLMTLQMIKAKDEQIQMLQNQLNAMQTAAATSPRQIQITREPAQTELLGSQQTDALTLHLLQAKNDTILLLRGQLHDLWLQPPTKDTVIVESGGKNMQSANELVSEQETSDLFQALQDTMQLVKTLVQNLEEQIVPGIDSTSLSSLNKKDVPSPVTTDTILLVAYYELGEIKPLEEESILEQVKELCSNKNVTKIALSGYTDSSGNELINKQITNTRLNYLLESIVPWITREKVFFQNFGDAFASDKVVVNERRIEIRIHTK